jgi:hypothetical protein
MDIQVFFSVCCVDNGIILLSFKVFYNDHNTRRNEFVICRIGIMDGYLIDSNRVNRSKKKKKKKKKKRTRGEPNRLID